MLALEEWYIPDTDLNYCSSQQNEIKLHMRKIVADWMLDVCVDQRCQVCIISNFSNNRHPNKKLYVIELIQYWVIIL